MKCPYNMKYLPVIFFMVLSGVRGGTFIKNASAAQRFIPVLAQTHSSLAALRGRQEQPFTSPVYSALAVFSGHGVTDDALTALQPVHSSQKTNHAFFTGLFNRLKLHIHTYMSTHRSRAKGIDDDPSDDMVILSAGSSDPGLTCLTFSVINRTLPQYDVIRKPFIPPRG